MKEIGNKISNKRKIRYPPTRIKYSPTRIKSRNFLYNISYTGISKNDFYNENFILDVYVLLVKNLNLFSLSRKVTDKIKHEMVYMLWRKRVPSEFYRYICKKKKNYLAEWLRCWTTRRARYCRWIYQSKQAKSSNASRTLGSI